MKKENKIGTYRKNQKGFGFVKIDEQEEEIYIARTSSSERNENARFLCHDESISLG